MKKLDTIYKYENGIRHIKRDGEFIPEDVVLNDYFDQFNNQQGGMINGYMGGGMISQRKNYRGGGLISMMPFSRRIV